MNALEAHRVHVAAGVAGDQTAVHEDLRNRVPSAFRKRLGAVPDHVTALQQLRYERVLLEAIEGHVRIEQRILVVEPDDEAQ